MLAFALVFVGISVVYAHLHIGGYDLKLCSYLISTLHAGVVGIIGLIGLSSRNYDLLSLSTEYAWLLEVSIGYLLSDLVIIALWYSPKSIIAHHICGSVGLIASCAYGCGTGVALYYLVTELSTVPLNISWYMRKHGYTGMRLKIVGAILLLTYFVIRILPIPWLILTASRLTHVYEVLPSLIGIIGIMFLSFMNSWWFFALIRAVRNA